MLFGGEALMQVVLSPSGTPRCANQPVSIAIIAVARP